MRVDGGLEKGRFSTSCTFSVSHAFVNGMGDSFLLSCLFVVRYGTKCY